MIKIPVKTVERVAVTVYENVEVTKEIEFSGVINDYDAHFQDLINYLLTLNFVASSCFHESFKEFPGYNQGGRNACSLSTIRFCSAKSNRLTISVEWTKCSGVAYVILDIPEKD